MQGGWQGPMGTVGGLTRTFGLHHNFERSEEERSRAGVNGRILRRMIRYFRPYGLQWGLVLGCIVVSAGLNVLPPFCVGRILDHAIPAQDTWELGLLAGAMVGLAVVSGLLGVWQQALTARVGQGIMFDLRGELYRHLQALSLHFYTATRSGEIVSRINNDVNAVQGVAAGTLVTIVSNLATLTATSVALFSMHGRLALMAVLVVPAFYIPSRIVGRIRRRLAIQTQARQASLLAFLQERLHVGGSLLTMIFGQREADAGDFSEKSARLRDLQVRQAVVGRWLFMILSVFSAVGPALIFWYGGYQVMQRELTAGLLVAFAALLTLLYRPLMQLASVYVDVQAAVGVFERIFEYLDLVPEVRDGPGARELERSQGRLVFERVCFAYPSRAEGRTRPRPGSAGRGGAAAEGLGQGEGAGNEGAAEAERAQDRLPFALSGIDFSIESGQQVALVGPSGAGKTTVTYLVPRFYDPLAGRILLDGRDIREFGQESLRRQIGMVTQETFLFHASLLENLRYARPQASQEEIEAACRAANIHDFIAGLPEGYRTVVGERGFRLSGGEKQRVSIARALLKDPAILILDEATSSLDAKSEYLIQEALEKLLRGRTSLIIAHRLSTILRSDKIVVLERGRVVEVGRHEELVGQGGLYAMLFEQQFGKVLAAAPGP